MQKPTTLVQFGIALLLFVVVINLLPDRYKLLAGGTILLGALALHPGSVSGFATWIQGL